ncbi:MAG: phospholipase A [Deltaproteobacteria bacterium]|nr:phospholipase A [Deltaproteobacteria bacterium]
MIRSAAFLCAVLALSVAVLTIFSSPGCVYADSGITAPWEREKDEPESVEAEELSEEKQRLERALGTRDKSNFTPHKMNYGIIGTDDALMQISFKYRLISDWGMYFAFTNVIKWDIYESSTPYHDINFMPELFYRFTPKNDWLFSLDAGYWHDSNGRTGEEDRAWDQLFVRFNKIFEVKHVNIAWKTNVYYELGTNKGNQDIGEYLGWWDTCVNLLNILPTRGHNIDLELFMWSGQDGIPFKPGQFRAGIIYKLKYVSFQPSFYLQYFNGYGEVLIDHDVRTESWRIGLAFLY